MLAVGHGLHADYFDEATFSDHKFSRTDAGVDFNWGSGSPHPVIGPDSFSVRWSGRVEPRFSELYTFYVEAGPGEVARLWVNGQKLAGDGAASGSVDLRAGRRYDVVAEYAELSGTAGVRLLWGSASEAKQVIPVSQLTPAPRGAIHTAAWHNLGGTSVADLTAAPAYPASPDLVLDAPSFELPLTMQQRYGQRWQGYVHAPQTGTYYFHVSGDDAAELYLSNSRDPAGKRLVASLPGATEPREWAKYPQQASAGVRLLAGQSYYVELLHKQDTDKGHVAVGWTLPDGRFEGPIPGHALSPLVPEVRLRVDESSAYERGRVPARFTLTRDDSVPLTQSLYVHYALSGTAASGEDFETLHGAVPDAVVIPAGQRSATFSITPIDDALNEPQEHVTVGLLPADGYTLGPASGTTATFGLYSDDHIPAGTDVIPPDAAPSAFQYYGATSTRSIVDVSGMPFTQANRIVSNARPANVWDVQLYARNAAPVARDDVLEVSFWARNGDATRPAAHFQLVFEKAGAPYTKSLSANEAVTSTAWRQYSYAFRAAEAYDAASLRANLAFQLGFNPQALEIGGVTLRNYGPTVAPADLGRAGQTYQGRSASDAAWLEAANDRIDAHRRGDLTVVVRDAAGRPLPGAAVSLRMAEHEFGFGSAVVGSVINNTTDPNAERYREAVKELFNKVVLEKELFNKVVLENDLKWPGWQSNPDTAINAIAWLRQNGITDVRGHNLIWPAWRYIPASPGSTYGGINYRADSSKPDSQEEYEAHVAVDGPDAARAWLRSRILTHIAQEAGSPGVKGLISDWDVVNEPYSEHAIQDILGDGEMVEWFKAAHAADPGARLFLNDYPNLTGGPHLEHFFTTLQWLLAEGAPLHGIGFQGHFHNSTLGMDLMRATFDRFAAAFPSQAIQVTEFDQHSADEQLQADFLRDFMTLAYSHPALDAFVMWGFWQSRHWKPEAALYRSDWSIKPNGQQYKDLVFGDWWTDVYGTTGGDGRYAARGYAGTYDVTATFGNAKVTARTTLSADGRTLEVTLPVAVVAGRHVFYNNSSYDGRRAAADAGDDAAIAPDKHALLPGEAPGPGNVTSYTRGINGVVIDVVALPPDAALTANDFTVRRGRGGDPSGWITTSAPQISVRRGAGASGTDRVTLTWPDGALKNYWVQVTVKPTARTGLAAADVFYFGNLVGETGPGRPTWFSVDAADYVATRAALARPTSVTSRFDFDRDGRVSVFDLATVRRALGESLAGLTAGAVAPAASLVRAEVPVPLATRSVPTRRSEFDPIASDVLRE